MKELFLIIVSVTFILSCSNVDNKKFTKKEMKNDLPLINEIAEFSVAFYNVENLFDTEDDPLTSDDEFTPAGDKKWDLERYNHKLNNIASVFLGIDSELPLFIGVCEVENRTVLEDLISTSLLKKANYDIVHYDSPDTRGIDVGFFYKKDFFSVISTESLEVNFIKNPDVLTRDILYIKGELNNEIIHVFVNHWSSRRNGEKETEYKRLTAAKVLRSKIEEIQKDSPKAKILVMGDFNDYPNNKSLTKVLSASLQPKSDGFYNLATKLDRSDKGTHFYDNEWGMLDQMMVSNSWLASKKGNVLKNKIVDIYDHENVLYQHRHFGGIPNKTYSGNKYHGGYSDHLAISLKFELKK